MWGGCSVLRGCWVLRQTDSRVRVLSLYDRFGQSGKRSWQMADHGCLTGDGGAALRPWSPQLDSSRGDVADEPQGGPHYL